MQNERLEAIIHEFAESEKDLWRLQARRAVLEMKLAEYFSDGVAQQARRTSEGTLYRVETLDKVVRSQHSPVIFEQLRDQVDKYFEVKIELRPNTECLSLAALRNHPMHALMQDRLTVTRTVSFHFTPAQKGGLA